MAFVSVYGEILLLHRFRIIQLWLNLQLITTLMVILQTFREKKVGNSINNSKILKSLNYSKLTFRFVSNVDGYYILNHENISKEFGNSHTHTNYFSSMKTIDSDYYF